MENIDSPTAAIEQHVSRYRSGAFDKNALWDGLADLPADRINETLNFISQSTQWVLRETFRQYPAALLEKTDRHETRSAIRDWCQSAPIG